jgi:quercetin dioxygenase-like cupin family protein
MRGTKHPKGQAMSKHYLVRSIDSVPPAPARGSDGATMQVLLGPEDKMPRFHTRLFTLEPGGRIPEHRHDIIEHEQVVVEGELVLLTEEGERTVRVGDVVYLPPNRFHGYENRADGPARFICVVPATEGYDTEWK